MTLFQNKFRVESTRLLHWNYGQAGYYFVTICTKNRESFCGEVVNDEVVLSAIGEIVTEEWLQTAMLRANVELDTWIIMPNHLHLIVIITYKIEPTVETPPLARLSPDVADPETPQRGVSTSRTAAASEKWEANTLGSIIGQFKGKCTKEIRAAGYEDFAWQARFYDRIIRTEESLHKARQYIEANPANWGTDRDNSAGLYM